MKFFKPFILFFFLLVSAKLFAQTNSVLENDRDTNLFLLLFAMGVIGLMIGAAVAGSIAATLLILLFFAFLSTGIISVSVLTGLYKNSVRAGFKTFIYITSCLIGMVMGSIGVWIVFRLLHINISDVACVLTGLLAGLSGGLLIGFTATKLLPSIFSYCKAKFSLK